jgi:hypothetical protein
MPCVRILHAWVFIYQNLISSKKEKSMLKKENPFKFGHCKGVLGIRIINSLTKEGKLL